MLLVPVGFNIAHVLFGCRQLAPATGTRKLVSVYGPISTMTGTHDDSFPSLIIIVIIIIIVIYSHTRKHARVETIQYTLCPKKETKIFSVISPIKLGQIWWNLAHSFLNKFAAPWYERFPLHLNNVSTLPCETRNAHRARSTTALLDIEKLQNLMHLNCSLQSRKIWIQLITACGKYCTKVYKTCITDLELSTTPLADGCHNDDVIQLVPPRSQSLFQFAQISKCVFIRSSLAIFFTLCNQLDLKATVAVG